MHWRRKVGIGMCFIFMPAVAPLWALVFDVEVRTMIRVLTVLFVPSLIIALGGKSIEQDVQ
jgi:methylglyoxal synthase